MIARFICLFTALSCLVGSVPDPASLRATLAMMSGITLRLHVVAEDDTAEMQQIKGCVREAVQAAYAAENPDPHRPMLANAADLLPALTQAAEASAQEAGFTGAVCVSLERCAFDTRTLDGLVIPAGTYPALMVRLGSASGHNWWGLLDPRLAMSTASSGDDEGVVWDWSPVALWTGLVAWFTQCPDSGEEINTP